MIKNKILETKKDIQEFKQKIKEYNEIMERSEYWPMIEQYIDDCINGDEKLQKIVTEKISPDLTSFLILPSTELDDFNEFNFIIASKDGREVRTSERKRYEQYVHECFDNIRPFEPRLIEFEQKNRKLYI